MSATTIELKWSAVVEKPEHLPAWCHDLAEQTGGCCDDVVRAMLSAEMQAAGEKFIARFPELFRTGTGLV